MSVLPIEIPKRSACCSKNGEPLQQGASYHSVLLKGDKEGDYLRHDYCETCWNQMESRHGSSWKSVIPIAKAASELPKQRDERALFLLKETLRDLERPGAVAEAFVLALYLARRRRIVLRQEMPREGKLPLSVYEVTETEEMIGVPKIVLAELDVEKVQQELAQRFK
jgi:hypothetical protein